MKYELDKDHLFPSWPDIDHPAVYLLAVGKVHADLGCSSLGILFENPLKSHTHCLPRVCTTLVVAGF